MTKSVAANPRKQFFDNAGKPAAGYKLYTYQSGTTTPATTWQDQAGTVANTNPIILDSRGECFLWLTETQEYTIALKTSVDVPVWSVDDISGSESSVDFTVLATSSGSSKIGYVRGGTVERALNGLTCDNITALRALYKTGAPRATTSGYYTPGDGGGGSYYYDATDTTSADNGGTVIVAYDGARWKLNHQWPLSVAKFGAVNGIDGTSAINSAIIAAAGRPLYLEEEHIITSPIMLNWSSAISPSYQPATRLIGHGQGKTVIINRSGDYAIKNTVTPAQAAQTQGVRMTGGELIGFTVTVDGNSPAGSAGILLESFWMGKVEDVCVNQVKGHGIYIPTNTELSDNPDKYSCGIVSVNNVLINACTGWGILADSYSITLKVEQSYIVNNAAGGMKIKGALHNINNNTIAGNGTDGSSIGLHLAYASGAIPHSSTVSRNEFDNNWGTQLKIDGYNNVVDGNIFIQSGTQGSGGNAFRAPVVITLDGTNLSGTVYNNTVSNNLFRMDDATTQTLTGIYIPVATGVSNNVCVDNVFAPSSFDMTRYSFGSGQIRNYALENGVQVSGVGQAQYSSGAIVVATVGITTVTDNTPLRIALVGAYNPTYLGATNFNDANHRFTAPYDGLLRVSSNGIFQPTASASGHQCSIYIYVNGSAYHTEEMPNGFPAADVEHSKYYEVVISVLKGDQVELYYSVSSGLLYSKSTSTATTMFQML